VALVVVTTMDRKVQPLVRFVVGDLAQVDRTGESRFTGVPPLVSMEGRLQDALVRPDGALVTAGAMDRALSSLDGIALYQVNQPDASEVVVDVVAEPEAPASLTRDVEGALALLAVGLRVTARRVTAIAAESSGKFRIARRHFPLDLGLVVPGANGVSA
jgi:phenylacetate-CoA ligase